MARILLVFVSIWIVLTQGAAAQDAVCRFDRAVFSLVSDPAFTIAFSEPTPESGVAIASFSVRHGEAQILKGYLTASQGFGSLWLIPDGETYQESQIRVTFLEPSLSDTGEDAAFAVIQALPSTMYYMEREKWVEHEFNGAVWKLSRCDG